MNRIIKSLLSLLLVLLLLVGIYLIPLPSQADNSLVSARNNSELVRRADMNQ